ncbi:MAG: alpha/beta hydrolase [Azonexus sp.]|jgi:non-heme chloroperoxidase|nr:alpha/beta hydrolase [Azonexus sp.]
MRTTQFTGHDGLPLVADILGDPARPPVILLHGGGQTRFAWGDTARGLVDSGFYVVSLDLRGHGDSGWADDGAYGIENYVSDLKAICATLPQAPALIGASLGGITSLLAVGESATPVATALVLVDVAPRINQAGSDNIKRFMRSAPNGFASLEEAADAIAQYLPHRPRPNDLSGLRKNLRPGPDGRFRWHWDPKVLEGNVGTLSEAYERLAAAARNIRIPALLVRGGRSDVVTDDSVRDFLDLIPAAEYQSIPGAHHMVAGDRNTAFSAAVIDFIQRRASAPARVSS